MTVLSIEGKPLPSALSHEQKEHHPERVMRRRQQLSKVLKDLQDGWTQDNGEDVNKATRPASASIDRHYDERWREQCRVASAAQEAVDVDPEAMANWIAVQRVAKAKYERWSTPFHKLHDLEEFQFRLVGQTADGTMWLSSHVALCVADNGVVKVYFRDADRPQASWTMLLSSGRQVFGTHLLFTAIDYTPQELFALLGAMRVEKITWPTEDVLAVARTVHPDLDERVLNNATDDRFAS